LIAAFLLCLPAVAGAQEEEKQTSFVYATYFECDVSKQWRVDEIVETSYAPAFDAAVEAGAISSWGWAAHHTGGKWRRILYYSAPSIDVLLDAPGATYPKIGEANPNAVRELEKICGSHDDYIWQMGTSSRGAGAVPQERGKVGFSVYFYCDMSKEERADEIVEEVFAPIYNRHVAEGNLTSWGWLKHDVGGRWRRLGTMTATDAKALMAARGSILGEIGDKHEAASNEFSEICGSHQDYIWNLLHETP
jgi:hypothetical protein